MTLLIGAFIVSKVLVQDIFNNRHILDSLFKDMAKGERIYFHFYGMTLVALLTDLVFKRFGTDLLEKGGENKSGLQIRHKIFEDLLEPMEPDAKPYSLNYSTFKYSPDRQKRWDEMYNYFVKFIG